MKREIRTIHESEADGFLDLLCGVFGLDASQARHIFYTEPFFDLERKWALFEGGVMRSILTTTQLTFGWGRAIGIAGVATCKVHQGKGLGTVLLEHVLAQSERAGEGAALLFAHRTNLYGRVGFTVIDRVIRGRIAAWDPDHDPPEPLPQAQVQALYDQWSSEHPSRLRRDARRWHYWSYVMRKCLPVDGGYLCVESDMCREALGFSPRSRWPVPANTEWFGLASMARALGVPLGKTSSDLLLMGYRLPEAPQMFMTDQF